MSLLDSFLMIFESEGLKELPKEAKEAEKAVDDFGDSAEEAEKKVDGLDKAVIKDIQSIKKLAIQASKTIAPFVLLGKAINETIKFADQALEVAEAAQKAGLTLEQFQLKDGNKYAIYTREDVNNAKEYEMVMRDIRMGTMSISAEISRMLLPALVKLLKIVRNVVDFFVDHGAFIRAVFIGVATAVTIFAIPAIINLGRALTGLLFANPMLLAISAAILAIALIVEDFYKWMHGEPSVAELLFGDFKEIQEAFTQGFASGVKKIFEIWLNSFSKFYDEIWAKMPKWLRILLSANAMGLAMNITGAVKSIKGRSSNAHGLDYVPDDDLYYLHRGERVQTAAEANDWRSGLMAAKSAVAFTGNYPLNSIPSSSTSNRTINIGDITIQTQATDAQGIAVDLASYIKQAVISLDDGMLA